MHFRSKPGSLRLHALSLLVLCAAAALLLAGCTNPTPTSQAFEYVGYGANQVVSGALHVVSTGSDRVILDAGAFYGDDWKGAPPLPADTLNAVSAVVITHAHSDHIGRLVRLVKDGYGGPVYSTEPTRELMRVMLPMSARYADMGTETFYYSANSLEKNRKADTNTQVHLYSCALGSGISSRNRRTVDSTRPELEQIGFYMCRECTKIECDEIVDRVQVEPPGKAFGLTSRLQATFYGTPHLPGSAMVRIVDSQSKQSLLYTGDLGSGLSPYLPVPGPVPSSDVVIAEGTYGTEALTHGPDERTEFRRFLGESVRAGKRVIIPAFVLDRTQQVLGEITQAIRTGDIPAGTKVKVYSPSALAINEIYENEFMKTKYSQFFTPDYMRTGPFSHIYEDGEDLNVYRGEIAVCSSGMASHAYAKDFVQRWIEDPNTVFVFVGYQDPETLGGQLTSLERRGGAKRVSIDGKDYAVRATVWRTGGFSGHAAYPQIISMLSGMSSMKTLILVHLDKSSVDGLVKAYSRDLKGVKVIAPKAGVVTKLGL